MNNSKRRVALGTAFGLILAAGFLVGSCSKTSDKSSATGSEQKKKEVYHCPMHPSITSDHPGTCPICQMRLQKVDGEEPASPSAESAQPNAASRKILFYRHPMRPEITSPKPAKDEMGMDYISVYEDEAQGHEGSSVEGRGAFSLSQEKQQLIGVVTAPVQVRLLGYEIRASGRVAFDPELYTAAEEYRQALLSRRQMREGPIREQADELVSSAKTKLKLMGLGDAQIQALGTGRSNPMALLLPKGSVWIYAEVFESETSNLKPGLGVEVEAPSISGKIFLGKISSVSPIVTSSRRTIQVRALVPDPEGLLRPDTFVNVKIKVNLGEKLSVPEDAVLSSGDQTYVFVAKEKGRFEPRAIQVGTKTRDYYEVLSGLVEGEKVVAAANFLIDSESRLRSVLRGAMTPSPPQKEKK